MAILDRGLKRAILARLYSKLLHKFYVNDIWIDVRLAAKKEAVDYVLANMGDAIVRRDRYELLKFALSRAMPEGLVLEFGVEKGVSLRVLARNTDRIVYGFDSFEGLPADWRGTTETRGKFSTKSKLPAVPSNVRFRVGWFDATLPQFLSETEERAAFIHIDCDIYESTRTVFELMGDRIVSGTIIVFDEYFNYPGWRLHEFKAFQEFIQRSDKSYRYIGYSAEKGHVAVQIN
ncbi:MAG TPA: class I SAM-dependent methyltransferase [Alphaproteobacteria bacterium]|nr:class I SAM-dependent methyltransferase [Alphaproteobacteria bacterium]